MRTYPIEQFLRHPTIWTMRISPDANYIGAIVSADDGKPALVVLDRFNLERTAVLSMGGRDQVHDFAWVADDHLIVRPARQEGMLDKPLPTGELFGVDAEGERTTHLFGYRLAREGSQATNIRGPVAEHANAYLLDPLESDPHQILITVEPWGATEGTINEVRRLNLRSGRTSRVASAPVRHASFLADLDGNLRLAWGDTLAGLQELYMRPAAGGDWRKIHDEAGTNVRVRPVSFLGDGERVHVITADRSRPSRLEVMNPATGERELVVADPIADIDYALFGPDRQIYAVIVEPDRPRLLFVDERSDEARLSKALETSFPGRFAYFTSFSRNGRYGLVHVYGDRSPTEFYLFDRETMQADFLIGAQDWIDPDDMAEMRPIRVQAHDGLDLHGYLTLPPGHGEKNLPMIVVPHGGPHGYRDSWGFDPEMQLLANRGYAVLQVNFRASGGYGLAFEYAGYRQWAGHMQDDLAAAVRWAIAQGHADPERICIYGASYGGYAAMMNPVRYPDLYRCAVGYIGVYDLRRLYSEGDGKGYLYQKAALERAIGTEHLASSSPVSHADRIKIPVMLVHGGEDQRAPVSHARRMRAALRAAGNEPEWLLERREGHGFYQMDRRINLQERLLAFFERHIGRGDSTASQQGVDEQVGVTSSMGD